MQQHTQQTPDGLIHTYMYDADGKIQGIYKIHTPEGALISLRTLLNSTPHGIHQEYYHNGQLKSQRCYNAGQEIGLATYYHPDGVIASTCMMDNGKRIGICRGYWPNGNYTHQTTYSNGVRHGPSYEYYETGRVHVHEEYICGQMTRQITYNEVGEIVEERGSPPRGRICPRCGPKPCNCLVEDPKPFRIRAGASPGSKSSGSAPPSPTNSYFDLI